MGFVGLENYRYIFFYDLNFVPMFLQTVSDTLLNTPICLVFSLAIAILINRPMKGRGFFRAAFFIPVLLGAGYVMKQMLGMGADGTTITTGIVVPQLIADLLGHSLTEFLQGCSTASRWCCGSPAFRLCCFWRACRAFPPRSTRQRALTARRSGRCSGKSPCR